MLQCLSLQLSSSSSPSAAAAAAPNGNTHPHPPPPSQGGTSSEASPSATLTHEYTRAVQSQSYNEIWSKVHQVHDHHHDPGHDELQLEEEDHDESDNEESRHRRSQRQHQLLLGRVLQPNRECVQEALRLSKPNTLTRLVSDYFDQSENTTQACLQLLHRSVYRARELYAPLHQLLDAVVHSDSVESSLSLNLSLSQSQCRRALDVFLQFDLNDNPFPSPDDADSPNLDNMRRCFSQLKLQLDSRLRSSRSKIRLIRRATLASALCFIGTAVGVAVSAVAVTVHALTAALVVVAAPPLCCTASSTGSGSGRSSSCCNCSTMTTTEKKEIANMKQLDAAAKGTCVLDNDLATIDRLVRRLHAAVEGDKLLVRLGLERGSVSGSAVDKHPIQEVLKQLHKSHPNFLQLVDELEEHICLCFNTVNSNVPKCIIALRTYHLLSAALLTDEGGKMRQRAHSAADSHQYIVSKVQSGLEAWLNTSVYQGYRLVLGDSFSWMYDPVILPVPGDSFTADDHQVDVRCEIVNTITHSSRQLT